MECPVCLESKPVQFLQCIDPVCDAFWDRIRDRKCPVCRRIEPGNVINLVDSDSDSESDSESLSDSDDFEVTVEIEIIN